MDLVDELNSYLTEQQPWILAKEESNLSRVGTILYTALEGLRVLAVALAPFTPKASAKLWAAIGTDLGELEDVQTLDCVSWGQLGPGTNIGELDSLFPRIEQEEKA